MNDNSTLGVAELAAKLIRMVDKEGEDERLLRVRTWFLNTCFYRDQHYGTFDAQGTYKTLPDEEQEDLRYTSDFMFSIESQATQWSQSDPEISLKEGSDSNLAKSAKRHAEKELEPYKERFWTEVFKQSMAKFAMLSTCYWINTRPKLNPDAKVKVPKFSQKQISAPKTFFCEGCGEATDAGEKCPNCGSEMASSPGYDADASIPNGLNSMPEVDCDVELVDPMEIKIDPKCRAAKVETADWMRRERYLRDYEAEGLHPGWQKITDSASSPAERSDALEYKRGLELSMGGWTPIQEQDSSRVLQRQYWFDKKVYKDHPPCKQDEEYCGVKFKAGEKLIDRYPDGWYIEKFNGKGVALFNEDKNKRWVGGVDTVDPSSPYGRGRSGLRNLQEMKDEGVSLMFSYAMRAALGTSLYDPMGVEASDYEQNRVGGAIPLKPGFQIEGRGIEKAVWNVPFQSINNGITQDLFTVVDEAMPKAGGGTYDILGGGQGEGAGAKTLGGQTQQLQTSAGMVGPALKLQAMNFIECFYQYLELVQQYASDAHYQEIVGSWGDADAEAFKNCKDEQGKSTLRQMIKITPVANSEIPRSQMERRNDVGLAISSGIANPELPMLPGVRKYGLEQLRIPIQDDPEEQGKRVAEALLEKMKMAAKYAQGMAKQMGITPDPMAVAQGISSVAPLVKQRDDTSLPMFKEVFSEFLRSSVEAEEGIDSDPALQQAVMLKLDEIEQFDVGLATDANAKQALVQAPSVLAENAISQQGQQPDNSGEQAQLSAQAEQGTAAQAAAIQSDQAKEQALTSAHQSEIDAQHKMADHAESQRQRVHDASEAQKARDESAKDRAHQLAMIKAKPNSK